MMFGLSPTLILAVVLSAGGLFAYHKIVVSVQQTEISNLKAQNATLAADVEKAVNANKSMEGQIGLLQAQSTQMVTILSTLSKKDGEVAQWFNEARNIANSPASRVKLQEKLKQSPATVIEDANRDVECTLQNFGQAGTCVDGKFVPWRQ